MVEKHAVVYTMKGCPHCIAAKKFLDSHGVEYEEFDVYESDEKWREAMEKAEGNDIVPVIDIEGTVLYGAWSKIKEPLEELVED